MNWTGILQWAIGVGLFWGGCRWGRARERFDQEQQEIQSRNRRAQFGDR